MKIKKTGRPSARPGHAVEENMQKRQHVLQIIYKSSIPLEIASKIKPAIWQSTMNKMIAYKVHLSFFDIGLGLTPEAAWMDLDKTIKPITIATMSRFI